MCVRVCVCVWGGGLNRMLFGINCRPYVPKYLFCTAIINK